MFILNDYEEMIYSQNGEDGILRELFNRLNITNGHFVEFGVEDGLQCNTAFLSRENGWSGLLLEGSPNMAKMAKENYRDYPNVTVKESFITKENIVSLLEKGNVPKNLNLLSVDIDGNDYWVLREILKAGYEPGVIVCEYNGYFKPPVKKVMEYNPEHIWDGTTYYGASLTSLTNMVESFHYSLLGTDTVGVNAFYIHNQYLPYIDFPMVTPEQAYHEPQFRGHMNNGNKGHLPKDGMYLEI